MTITTFAFILFKSFGSSSYWGVMGGMSIIFYLECDLNLFLSCLYTIKLITYFNNKN